MTDETDRFRRWVTEGRADADHPAIPAATVILLRDRGDGLETLMLRRNSKLAFGGMWVFPGGRVDETDHERAADGTSDEFAAARRAAVREATEESGLVVAVDDLVAFSHWTPPPQTPKRFSTWFFVAPAPAGTVTIDDGEIHEHMWVAPADAIRRRDEGAIELAPPTWVTLHALADVSGTAAAIERARASEPLTFVTHVAATPDGLVALWEGDAGYETADGAAAGPRHRLVMADAGWRYERDHP